ncbi:MAG: hypothetical protein HQM13_01670 [SAR324 cluster bacterium]|nr:hypothetical protein [SAR324 cluster bacterium]
MSQTALWRISILVSLFWVGVIGVSWYWKHNSYNPNPGGFDSSGSVKKFLSEHRESFKERNSEEPIYVPTGFFIQSLRFMTKTDIQLKGYIWQKYPLEVPDSISRDFILPELVDAADTFTKEEMYREKHEDYEVIGWYFEAIMRHHFNYHEYPLDHKTVTLRLWPKNFTRNVIFTPDFEAYPKNLKDILGIEEDIVLRGWTLDETFFKYHMIHYQTDFGIGHMVDLRERPELSFNIVIVRDFHNAFIVHLMPLMVVLILLFAVVISISKHPEKKEMFGANMHGIIGSCSSLFFVIMLSHIHLRQEFLGAEVVYVEYFYFLSYAVLLVVALDSYIYLSDKFPNWSLVHSKDNVMVKVLYWPLVTGISALFTVLAFFSV